MPLTFKDIPHGATILIDANIFIYYFTAHPQFGKACDDLLDRVDRHEIGGVTSSDVLADVSHRLMTLEAADSLGWSMSGIGHRLKHNPAEVQKLVRYRQALEEVFLAGIHVLPVLSQYLLQAADISRTTGLLTNDALVGALMADHSILHLASNYGDFDRLSGVTRYAP